MYSTLARSVFFPLYQIYSGGDISKHLRELEKTQWLSIDEVRKIQWKKLKKILEYAYGNVPYYRNMFEATNKTPRDIESFEDFGKLPILDKKEMIENPGFFISSDCKESDLEEHFTGGSTGEMLRFFLQKRDMEQRNAVEFRGDRWAGLEIGEKYVKLWGNPTANESRTPLKDRIRELIFRSLIISSYNLSDESMHRYAQKVARYKPKVIIGYASSLDLFAKFLDSNKIEGVKPESVVSTAEMLYDSQRRNIESVFDCRVFNRYGCNEFNLIAQECSQHSGMHIAAEHVYVECVKSDGKPAGPEEQGELIITDLDNYAFPFIRYKIGDLGRLSYRACPCGIGLPLLESVEGRIWDVLVGANGHRIVGGFYLVKAINGIKKFQIIQEKLGELVVKLVVDELFTGQEKQKLLERTYATFGENMKIDIQIVDEIPLPESGKRRYVISKVSPFVKQT